MGANPHSILPPIKKGAKNYYFSRTFFSIHNSRLSLQIDLKISDTKYQVQTPSFGYLNYLKCRNFLSHEGRIFSFKIHDKSKTKVQKVYNRIQNFIYNIYVSINKAGGKLPYKSIFKLYFTQEFSNTNSLLICYSSTHL